MTAPEGHESPSHEDMHRDYNLWRSEHAAWLDDICHWVREHRRAEGLIYRIEHALPNLGKTLKRHEESIRQHERLIEEHEKLLADCIAGVEEPHNCTDLDELYDIARQRQDSVQYQHEHFRSIHRETMLELKRLLKLMQDDLQE